MLARHGVDALHGGQYATLLALAAHFQVLLHHVAFGGFQYEAGNLEVAETGRFHLAEEFIAQVFHAVVTLQFVFQIHNVLQTLQEPFVYLGQLFYPFYGIAFFQSLGDGEDAQVGGVRQLFVKIVETGVVVAHKSVHALAYHA